MDTQTLDQVLSVDAELSNEVVREITSTEDSFVL